MQRYLHSEDCSWTPPRARPGIRDPGSHWGVHARRACDTYPAPKLRKDTITARLLHPPGFSFNSGWPPVIRIPNIRPRRDRPQRYLGGAPNPRHQHRRQSARCFAHPSSGPKPTRFGGPSTSVLAGIRTYLGISVRPPEDCAGLRDALLFGYHRRGIATPLDADSLFLEVSRNIDGADGARLVSVVARAPGYSY